MWNEKIQKSILLLETILDKYDEKESILNEMKAYK